MPNNGKDNHSYVKTTVTLVLLSVDEDTKDMGLGDMVYAMTEGGFSGDYSIEVDYITREEMREELVKQGSDPSFLLEGEDDSPEYDELVEGD